MPRPDPKTFRKATGKPLEACTAGCTNSSAASTTMLVEEIALNFTESHVLSFYPLACQSYQVSLTAFSGAMNPGFPLLTHSGSPGNMAAALPSSHGPGRAPVAVLSAKG